MPNPLLLDILINLVDALKKIKTDNGYFTNISNVFSFVSQNHSDKVAEMPFVNVLIADADQQGQESFKTNKIAFVAIQIWVTDEIRNNLQAKLMKLDADVIKAVMEDKTRGGKANWTHEGNTTMLIPFSDSTVAGAIKIFNINYDHNDNNATTFVST